MTGSLFDMKGDDAWLVKLRQHRKLGSTQQTIDAESARHILHEELGYYADAATAQRAYHLDDETRDRLIAHARQDSSHAIFAIASLASEMRRKLLFLTWLMILNICLIAGVVAWFQRRG
jgi:hypothetical protein